MSDFVLDHLFILTAPGGSPEIDELLARGFVEGPPNRHPGQGTACRRFFLSNAMIEFLWVENETEARSDTVQPLRLWERWQGRGLGACPFGIALRPTSPDVVAPPFPAFDYWPSFFPAPAKVSVKASIIELPLTFCLPYFERPEKDGPTLTHYQIDGNPPNYLMEIEFAEVPPLRFAMIADRPHHV